jgi:diguanylate cyclase (GGDEF)-like protein/PAS domain S-box-containing protein
VLLLMVALLGPAYESSNWRIGLLLTLALGLATVGISLTLQRQFPVIVDAAPFWIALLGLYGQSLVRRIDPQQFRFFLQRLMLNRSDHLMHHVIENSFDAIVTVGPDDVVEAFNSTARKMFGHAEAEIVGRDVAQLFPATVAGEAAHPLSGATGHPVECLAKRRDGSVVPVELVVAEVDSGRKRRRVAFLRDITERKSQQEILEHQATHDPLTDLPNRGLLSEKIREALSRHSHESAELAVLLLDLDRFKEINDALGHCVGDRLLQKIARRLSCPLDESAVLARLGGDEFAILLSDCNREQAQATALRLVEALRAPFDIDDVSLQIDTSIGIAMFPDHAGDEETLIRLADVAMYVAKRRRTAVTIYEPEDDPNSLRHLTLRADLRRAIEHNELNLVYQPKVDSRSEAIVGVEALLRWNHAQHGPISPEEFIGLAERTGLIRSLTQWVCRTAVAQCAEWNRLGTPLGVALNLSARNLLEEDLPEALQRILDQWEVPASQLTLEITESVIMDDPERALHVVTALRNLGVGISIDEFGTGYSS